MLDLSDVIWCYIWDFEKRIKPKRSPIIFANSWNYYNWSNYTNIASTLKVDLHDPSSPVLSFSSFREIIRDKPLSSSKKTEEYFLYF